MIVGTLKVRLVLRQARSPEGETPERCSIKDKLRNSFNVAVAEIEDQDQRQSAVLGIVTVGNETHPLKVTLGQIADALRAHPVAEFASSEMETVPL